MCADNVSNCSDWNDRATCVLFGDGAGAAVLAEGSDLLSIELTTTGDYEYLRIPRGENACPMYRHPSERPVLHMNGREVYKFAGKRHGYRAAERSGRRGAEGKRH